MHYATAGFDQHVPALAVADRRPASRTRVIGTGSIVYSRASPAGHLYRVDRGLLISTLETSAGRRRAPDLHGPGDILGSAALEGGTHFETVSALRDSVVQIIPLGRLAADLRLLASVSRSLAGQVRRAKGQADDQGLAVGARLARLLLRLGPRLGTPTCAGFALPREMTHEMLAELVGASRVTVTKVVNELQARGAITGGRGRYAIDVAELDASIDGYVVPYL